MNRRQFLASIGTSLGALVAANSAALAALRAQSESTPTTTDKPDLLLEDYSQDESLYLGVLFTWLELLEDTIEALYDGIDAVEVEPDSLKAKARMLMPLGVWSHLAMDTVKLNAPETFAETHVHALDTFAELGNAADVISTGVIAGSATAVTLGTEHIREAAEHVGQLIGSLPFSRPSRAELLG